MTIKSLKTAVKKRAKKDQLKQDYSDIGSLIKKTRFELKKTQEEVCQGICSISYLSKIENNNIIPKTNYLEGIMARLKIEEEIYNTCLQDKKQLVTMIESIFYFDSKEVTHIFNEINHIDDNVVIDLMKLSYYIYHKDTKAKAYVERLEDLTTNMDDFEIRVYLYLSMQYYIQNNDYKMALELYLLAENLTVSHPLLQGLILELGYSIKQRLFITNSSIDLYVEAKRIFLKYNNVDRLIALALEKSKYLLDEYPKKALTHMNTIKTRSIPKTLNDKYHYIKAKIFSRLNETGYLMDELKHISIDSDFYFKKLLLLMEVALNTPVKNELLEIKTKIDNYDDTKIDLEDKIYYQFLSSDDKQDVKSYLRSVAIPFSIKVCDYRQLKFYIDQVIAICEETSRYKEGIGFYNKYKKEMARIKKILF